MSLISAARTGLRRLATGNYLATQAGAVRTFATPAAKSEADDDFVFGIFKEQQRQFRELTTGLQAIPVPLTGDDKAVAAYAAKVEALKASVGAPTVLSVLTEQAKVFAEGEPTDRVEALLTSLDAVSSGDAATDSALRQWASDVKSFTSGPAKSEEEVAAASESFAARLGAIAAKLPEGPKDAQAAALGVYKAHVTDLRKSVEADVAKVRDDAGLDFVQVDLSAVSPKA